jgi:hypothetical protein
MATATELTTKLERLDERVSNNISFFRIACGLGLTWLSWLSVTVYNLNNNVKGVAAAQANAPAQIVASLLNKPNISRQEAASYLDAATVVLKNAKLGPAKPAPTEIRRVSDEFAATQEKYADLPQVWGATSAFIAYKSLLLPAAQQIEASAKGHTCTLQIGQPLNGISGAYLKNCEINLEEITSRVSGNWIINGVPMPFIFINCLVHYRGGAIPGKKLIFINSIFQFEVTGVPAPEGVITMRQLTTADINNSVTVQLG